MHGRLNNKEEVAGGDKKEEITFFGRRGREIAATVW